MTSEDGVITYEVWKPVPAWESRYEASSFGRIRSARSKELRATSWNYGYENVSFYIGRKSFSKRVGRIICETFHGTPEEGQQANHINAMRWDNRPENLEWVTPKQNTAHKFVTGTAQIGERHWKTRITAEDVYVIRERCDGSETLVEIAADYGMTSAAICNIKYRKSWRYLPERKAA